MESARLLIQELHPVDGARILSQEHQSQEWKDTEHITWCLRALRTLTGGLEFRATTSHHFGNTELDENREWFTGGDRFKKDGTLKFFGVWMSRDSLYIAPKDAQAKIIEKWKTWYKIKGKNFAYSPFKNDPDLYYF